MTNDEKNPGGLIQIKTREDVCPGQKLSLAAVRDKIDHATAHDASEKTGPEYWRSLEELAGSKDFQDALHREFPKGASEWVDSVSRRGFLKVMGASLGLAGMTGCVRLPLEPIVPYVRQPEDVIPGRPMFYATAMTLGGYASPLLVESHLGRPTKIEGNDQHPASLGGTDIFAQASLLGLYDPDRSQSVVSLGDQRSWQAFLGAIRGPLSAQKALKGAGIRILTPTISSPTLADQMRNLLKIYPAGQVARLRAGQSRQRARRREARLRPARRDPLRFLESRCYRLARRRLPLRRIPRQHEIHPRLRQAPQSRQRKHEPPVRDRKHADLNRGQGGSSAAAAGG